jgi:D-alanyl-D-alanine carboxypeptidase
VRTRRAAVVWAAMIAAAALILEPHAGTRMVVRPAALAAAGKAPSRARHTNGRTNGTRQAQRLSAWTTVLAYPPPPVQARAALLLDMTSREILYAKHGDRRLPMASTTKIMTAAVVLAHARLNEMVRVSKKAASIGESTMALVKGERLTVKQLLYGLLLNSGNDAAIALAEHVGGTERGFVGMMNALARHLGMRNTHYATPHGLDAPHHYTSARDLATIAMYAMRDRTFRTIVDTASYHIRATRHNKEHWLANINQPLYWFPGVDGIKPGQTDAAGFCQVISAWRGGHHLLAVLLNTPTMVNDLRDLLDFGSRNFRWVQAPAWWDYPAEAMHGGSGVGRWLYYVGAGHYIRGEFLHYFITHGGLKTLGYPRTEEIEEGGRVVQYFQGGELAADGTTGLVLPVPLGSWGARVLKRPMAVGDPGVVHGFLGTYAGFGGVNVLGPPVTGATALHGETAQFYRYGAIVQTPGGAVLAPLGDWRLRLQGWLPVSGAANVYPPTIAGALSSIPGV